MAAAHSSAEARVFSRLTLFLVVIAVVACLALAKPVLVPLALAVVLAFVLNPCVVALNRRGVPRVPAVLVVVALVGLALGVCGWILTAQLVEFLNRLPLFQDQVAHRILELRQHTKHSTVAKVEDFVNKVTTAATAQIEGPTQDGKPLRAAPDQAQPVTVVNRPGFVQFGPLAASVSEVAEILAMAALVAVFVIYILIKREDLRNRLLRLLGEGRMTHTTKALEDAAQGVSNYLLAQLVVNIAFGLCVGVGLRLVGLPYPLLWGVSATILRYIPFVGPWLALSLPLALSLLTSSGWTQPLVIIGVFVGFELAANVVVEPLLYGQSMGVSPLALLLALAFWSWLWGGIGLVLAVPLTVCLLVLGKHVPQLKFLEILLGDEPVLTPDVRFYQRLLARDQDEASEVVRNQLKEIPIQKVFDDVLIPALVYVRRDLDAKLLAKAEAESMHEMMREIVEEHGPSALESPGPITQASSANQVAPKQRLAILACAARDTGDETALDMFQRILDPKVCCTELMSTDRLVSEVVSLVAEERPSIVCIASLPPGGLTHTRLLCKRLRNRFPNLKIVVGRWGLKSNIENNRDQLVEAGADHFGTTLQESSTQLVQLAQFVKAGGERPSVDRQHQERQSLATARARKECKHED